MELPFLGGEICRLKSSNCWSMSAWPHPAFSKCLWCFGMFEICESFLHVELKLGLKKRILRFKFEAVFVVPVLPLLPSTHVSHVTELKTFQKMDAFWEVFNVMNCVKVSLTSWSSFFSHQNQMSSFCITT